MHVVEIKVTICAFNASIKCSLCLCFSSSIQTRFAGLWMEPEFLSKKLNETSVITEISFNLFKKEVVGQGLAFLRKSHGGCNMPPACCQEPPFESILAHSPLALIRPGLDFFFSFLEVVGQNGLEPSTSRLSVVCSSQLSYWPIWLLHFSGTSFAAPSKLNNASST